MIGDEGGIVFIDSSLYPCLFNLLETTVSAVGNGIPEGLGTLSKNPTIYGFNVSPICTIPV